MTVTRLSIFTFFFVVKGTATSIERRRFVRVNRHFSQGGVDIRVSGYIHGRGDIALDGVEVGVVVDVSFCC